MREGVQLPGARASPLPACATIPNRIKVSFPTVVGAPSGSMRFYQATVSGPVTITSSLRSLLHGSPGAPMGQTKEEEAGAGALQRLQLTPHGLKLMPSELVDAEHAINTPWTTPCPTTAEVDSIGPNFKNSGGDPRVPEVSFASMERRGSPCCQAQHRLAQRVGGGPRPHFDRILLPPKSADGPKRNNSAVDLLAGRRGREHRPPPLDCPLAAPWAEFQVVGPAAVADAHLVGGTRR